MYFMISAMAIGTIKNAITTRKPHPFPVDSLSAVTGPINPDKPKPAENGVPDILSKLEIPPAMADAMITGINSFGLDNMLAI